MIDDRARRPRNGLFDRIAPFWEPLAGSWALGPVLARLPEDLPDGPVVDLGGATGRLARRLAQAGRRAVVVDASAPMVRRARRRGLPSVRGSGAAIPLADRSAAGLVVLDALHHMPEIPLVISEIARVLAPGGAAVLFEPDPETLFGRIVAGGERLLGMNSLLLPEDALAGLLGGAGLDVGVERTRSHLLVLARQRSPSTNAER